MVIIFSILIKFWIHLTSKFQLTKAGFSRVRAPRLYLCCYNITSKWEEEVQE
jgi:hypothetical protein